MLLTGILGSIAFLILLAIAAAARAGQNSTLIYGASAAACLAAFGCAVAGLLTGCVQSLTLPIGLPWIGAHFRIDALSALFLCLVSLGGFSAGLYAMGYGRHAKAPQRVVPFFPLFLAAMMAVTIANDAFIFLLSWELMSLASWALVVSNDKDRDARRAGLIYIVMASLGTLCLMAAFGLLAGNDGLFVFDTIRQRGAGGLGVAVLLLALAGTGSKAGLFPLHAWLPLAHPAAPSHISALMSGVMTKVAVYAFVRIAFDFIGPADWRLSLVVMGAGAATAVLGILYALLQQDIKRLLAYSTVENIGIIFTGLGLAMAFRSAGLQTAAAVALTAALFHGFNHSLFKSLLFFGAGAVIHATGERDIEKMGGLIHRMPKTALFFLVAAAAISALPPLNGFASEWLTFQAIFLSPALPQWGLKFGAPAAGVLLALAAALTGACFVKATGVMFLSRPRSETAASAKETDALSLTAMGVLALLCLLAGLLPGFVTQAIGAVSQMLLGAHIPAEAAAVLKPAAASHNSYSGFAIFALLVAGLLVTAWVLHLFTNAKTRRAPVWDCGFPENNAAAQYSGSSFSQPIRRVFATLVFGAKEKVTMPPPGALEPASFRLSLIDPAWDGLYAPLAKALDFVTLRLNALQFLTIRSYLAIVFVTLVLLLAGLAI